MRRRMGQHSVDLTHPVPIQKATEDHLHLEAQMPYTFQAPRRPSDHGFPHLRVRVANLSYGRTPHLEPISHIFSCLFSFYFGKVCSHQSSTTQWTTMTC